MDYSKWIGRTNESQDCVSNASLKGLAAVLNKPDSFNSGEFVPPLFHWLHFLETAKQSDIDHDGHSKRGDFLPPVELPRRMWAGSRLSFHAPVLRDADLTKRLEILSVKQKTGRSGDLVFVTIRHDIFSNDNLAVTEEQDIVYMGIPTQPSPPLQNKALEKSEESTPIDYVKSIIPDPVLLFRYSALTFNSHRIHYDRPYTINEEGYPALVVHGPLLATLLMDHAITHSKGKSPSHFEFSARAPLFDNAPFDLCMNKTENGANLWTRSADGVKTMTASITWKKS